MGRRRKRKQERRNEQRSGSWANETLERAPVAVPDYLSPQAIDLLFGMGGDALDEFGGVRPVVNTCGGCREFVEDEVGGRGECLHPGSGVLLPWTDTAACPFYAARRR